MTSPVSDDAMDRASVAPASPDDKPAHDPRQQAGQDADIIQRLEDDPEDADAKLDAGLDESMDASDPPAQTQPGSDTGPAPSSGFDPKAEERLRSNA